MLGTSLQRENMGLGGGGVMEMKKERTACISRRADVIHCVLPQDARGHYWRDVIIGV